MSELTDLYRVVKTALESESPGVVVAFGRKESIKQLNQGRGRAGRVVFHEGDPGGDAGGETAARPFGALAFDDSEPRALVDNLEKFTIYVWGVDLDNKEDAAAQHDAAWALYSSVRRAIFNAANGRVTIDGKRWRSPERVERTFGRELEIVGTIRAQVVDEPMALVDDVSAHATVEALGETETFTTS